MKLEELSRKSYLMEDWCQAQTPEWDAMSNDGWEFTRPYFIPQTVGISMKKGSDSATFRVGTEWAREEINNRLLRFCKAFSELSQG